MPEDNDDASHPVASRAAGICVAIITPVTWKPEKPNFARAFELLSSKLRGYIFTGSEVRHRGFAVGRFRVFASRYNSSVLAKLRRMYCQCFLPILIGRRDRIDVVVAFDPYASGLAALICARVLHAKLIIELNGDYHEVAPFGSRFKRYMMDFVRSLTLRNADAVRVLNDSQKQWVAKNFPSTRVFKFADFAVLSVFEARPSFEGEYLLAVGFPFHVKGIDVLIDAYRIVAPHFPEVSLRVMGHTLPGELEKYQALAAGLPGVTFIKPGWIEAVADQMRGCIALVNPARTEALGRVHLEAMACGKPVIASRTNGALEVVVDGSTGLLVDIGNAVDLAEKIEMLLRDRDRAKSLGLAGRARVRSCYSEENYRDRYTSMIRQVANNDQ